MRRFFGLLGIVFACATPAEAQVSCGTILNKNTSWQPTDLKYVEAIVQTRRDYNICPLEVQVEAWVDGTTGAAAVSRNVYVAEVHIWQPVGVFKTYTPGVLGGRVSRARGERRYQPQSPRPEWQPPNAPTAQSGRARTPRCDGAGEFGARAARRSRQSVAGVAVRVM